MIAEPLLANMDIASREFKANPFPFYTRLRAEAPVYWTKAGRMHGWLITRYDDVVAVLKDDAHFVKNMRSAMTAEQLKKAPWMPPMVRPLLNQLLGIDGEHHARQRSLVHKAFTPRMIERMQGRVETLANDLLDQAQRRGSLDLVRDYALPIPITIISDMLGIEAKHQPKFYKWFKAVMEERGKNLLRYIPNIVAAMRFLRGEIDRRRTNPGDDLISALVQVEESGDRLTSDELLALIFVLLVAGYETTVNLISSGGLALMDHPDQSDLLRRDPALIKSAVEELLRFTSPIETSTDRFAMQDVTLHGVDIRKGTLVLVVIASANRDETKFASPDVLDITRAENKHVAFGFGPHYCVGAPLARLEGSIAIDTLVQRLPDLRLAVPPDALRWRPGYTVRGLESLPVVI